MRPTQALLPRLSPLQISVEEEKVAKHERAAEAERQKRLLMERTQAAKDEVSAILLRFEDGVPNS